MKKNTRFSDLLLSLCLILILTSAAFAEDPNLRAKKFNKRHPRRAEVNRREHRQDARIAAGVKNGKLTADQAKDLKQDEAKIKAEERADVKANGGYLTQDQKKNLNQELNAESKKIYQEKHPAAAATPVANPATH